MQFLEADLLKCHLFSFKNNKQQLTVYIWRKAAIIVAAFSKTLICLDQQRKY